MNPKYKPEFIWSYRIPGHKQFGEYFRGKFDTRHEAIGHATKFANSTAQSEWEVRWYLPIYEGDTSDITDAGDVGRPTEVGEHREINDHDVVLRDPPGSTTLKFHCERCGMWVTSAIHFVHKDCNVDMETGR